MEQKNKIDRKKLLQEKLKRESTDLFATSFEQQVNFVKDESKRKVALCSRRASKTYSGALSFIKTGLENPGCSMCYITMTLSSARRIMYKDIIEPLNDQFKLGLKLKQLPPEVHFPNGSVIYLVGIDSKEDEKNKLLGQKNKLIIIDEAQDITVDLKDLIERVCKPTLIDTNGQIIMMGTPSDNMNTYFYEVTKTYKSVEGWKYFSWNAAENPYVKENFLADIEKEKIVNPSIEETPSFRQMYMGQWVASHGARVYRWSERNFRDTSMAEIIKAKEKNINFELTDLPVIDELPEKDINGNFISYTTIMGIDVGYNDADAFVIGKYSQHDKNLYIIEAHTQAKNDDVATGMMIQRLRQRFDFNRIVIDGSSLKSVETMRQRMGIPLVAADKGKKADYIGMFNMDMDAGLIKIFPQPKKLILNEWNKLIWDQDPRKTRRELPGLHNHVSDALLYLWRTATNWSNIPLEQEEISDERHNQRMDTGLFDFLLNRKDEEWQF